MIKFIGAYLFDQSWSDERSDLGSRPKVDRISTISRSEFEFDASNTIFGLFFARMDLPGVNIGKTPADLADFANEIRIWRFYDLLGIHSLALCFDGWQTS
jgi:hypothetical protein